MRNLILCISPFLTGALISIMVFCNNLLGNATSNETALIVNQVTGIVLLTLILLAGHRNPLISPERRSAKWYMYFGGLFGIVIMIFNFHSVNELGATLAMAATVFGQSMMGLLSDLFGLFGMKKRKSSKAKRISLLISFSGIIVMCSFSEGRFSLPHLIMALAAGALTLLQMVYNSAFASAKGAFFSARQNAISGLGGILLYSAIFYRESTMEGLANLSSVPFHLLVGGGVLAVIVVVCANILIPLIPAVTSALLISAGQILTSLLIDKFLYGTFSLSLLAGALLMIAGMVTDFLKDRPCS